MEAALRPRTHRMLMLDGGLRPAPSRSPEVEQQLIATARSCHARSNGTKQPNDAWSGSSTTWPEANLALDSGDRGQRCSDTQPSTLGVELATGLPAFRVAYSFGGVLSARDVVTSLHQDCQGLGPV